MIVQARGQAAGAGISLNNSRSLQEPARGTRPLPLSRRQGYAATIAGSIACPKRRPGGHLGRVV
jgi:hypothetical protein